MQRRACALVATSRWGEFKGDEFAVAVLIVARGSEALSSGSWNKWAALFAARLCRESRLTARSDPTLLAAAGDGLIIPGGCHVANAGFGAAPQRVADERKRWPRQALAAGSKRRISCLRGAARSASPPP